MTLILSCYILKKKIKQAARTKYMRNEEMYDDGHGENNRIYISFGRPKAFFYATRTHARTIIIYIYILYTVCIMRARLIRRTERKKVA